jgi:alpha 1,3-glucosidase
MRLRRSSKLMHYDPLTLIVAPSDNGMAEGSVYLDDEHSLAHETAGAFLHRRFRYAGNVFTCDAAPRPSTEVVAGPSALSLEAQARRPVPFAPANTVERIELADQNRPATRAVLTVSVPGQPAATVTELVTFYDPARHVITIKKPDVKVAADWTIALEF